jgi:hypothetical protein
VLTDEEAADIRRKLEQGWLGPVLLTWLYRLLEDREERVRRETGSASDATAATRPSTPGRAIEVVGLGDQGVHRPEQRVGRFSECPRRP